MSARRQRKAGNTDLMLTQLAKHFRVGDPGWQSLSATHSCLQYPGVYRCSPK